MKKILLVLLVGVTAWVVQGCAPPPSELGYTYEYKYAMVNTMHDSAMYFKDGNIEILLDIKRDRISFMIVNLCPDALKVNWDESAIVFNGEAKKVIHAGVKIIDKEKLMPKTVIPPTARIEDFAIPVDNVDFSTYASESRTKDLLPSDDFGIKGSEDYYENVKNLKFSLYLPIIRKTEQIDYSFEFRVAGVTRKPKRGQAFINNQQKEKSKEKQPIVGPKRTKPKQ